MHIAQESLLGKNCEVEGCPDSQHMCICFRIQVYSSCKLIPATIRDFDYQRNFDCAPTPSPLSSLLLEWPYQALYTLD